MQTNEVLGSRLKELCEAQNITYHELGQKIGMPGRRIYRMANGMVSNPGVFTMLAICNGLDVTLNEFFNTEEFNNIWKERVDEV